MPEKNKNNFSFKSTNLEGLGKIVDQFPKATDVDSEDKLFGPGGGKGKDGGTDTLEVPVKLEVKIVTKIETKIKPTKVFKKETKELENLGYSWNIIKKLSSENRAKILEKGTNFKEYVAQITTELMDIQTPGGKEALVQKKKIKQGMKTGMETQAEAFNLRKGEIKSKGKIWSKMNRSDPDKNLGLRIKANIPATEKLIQAIFPKYEKRPDDTDDEIDIEKKKREREERIKLELELREIADKVIKNKKLTNKETVLSKANSNKLSLMIVKMSENKKNDSNPAIRPSAKKETAPNPESAEEKEKRGEKKAKVEPKKEEENKELVMLTLVDKTTLKLGKGSKFFKSGQEYTIIGTRKAVKDNKDLIQAKKDINDKAEKPLEFTSEDFIEDFRKGKIGLPVSAERNSKLSKIGDQEKKKESQKKEEQKKAKEEELKKNIVGKMLEETPAPISTTKPAVEKTTESEENLTLKEKEVETKTTEPIKLSESAEEKEKREILEQVADIDRQIAELMKEMPNENLEELDNFKKFYKDMEENPNNPELLETIKTEDQDKIEKVLKKLYAESKFAREKW